MKYINKYLIAPTSQFYYCGIPFRVDATSRCAYNCQYCFSKLRGGFRSNEMNFLEPEKLRNKFLNDRSPGIINELLHKKMPVHFGGMSDPNCEQHAINVTLATLDLFADNNYPVVVSTKNPEPLVYYERDLSNSIIIQVSFSTINPHIAKNIEPYTLNPHNRIKAIELLIKKGYRVTARIQPFFYSLKKEVVEVLIPKLIEVGVDHIILEHLKLPVETNSRNRLTSLCRKCNLSLDLYDKFGVRYGRSIILPNHCKLENILIIKNLCESNGVTFGAGDYGFYHFSSTNCCCGIDKYFPDASWFKGNFTNLIKCSTSSNIFMSELEKHDFPESSISMYINSHSRIENNSIKNLLINKWNKPGTANAVDSYYGIMVDPYRDDKGNYVYLKEIQL